MSGRDIVLIIVFAVVGGAIAWVYCVLVRYSVEDTREGEIRMSRFLALMLVRIALVVAGFVLAAFFGGWAIVGNIAGFFVVRTMAVGRARIADFARKESERMRNVAEQGRRHG